MNNRESTSYSSGGTEADDNCPATEVKQRQTAYINAVLVGVGCHIGRNVPTVSSQRDVKIRNHIGVIALILVDQIPPSNGRDGLGGRGHFAQRIGVVCVMNQTTGILVPLPELADVI